MYRAPRAPPSSSSPKATPLLPKCPYDPPHDRPYSESPGLILSNHCQIKTDSARFDGETSPDIHHEDSLLSTALPSNSRATVSPVTRSLTGRGCWGRDDCVVVFLC
ncbi:hypothetical protein NCU16755 [Neurospora crassa OR74A]|uniref:Uncharacterized protein n=1 Tax=Neurospora crassa (strain ATCC 24698 / 74-OR23-1A / CBS 708.71 / DSM 1257 / FGSC 987) TaxID=367110 RepID=V5IN40_NEUCR|nr:hypothetical protein NCU16755 [Neurospora crassa OR74A]ESA42800.1 hypothetical protein NCU16755 [Neurospora crassa OR74A]|eukprot:XP_011394370.1 hypothetical protein NCU16755 [Neurospora crassa OR74A]